MPTGVTSSLLRAGGGVQGLQARFLAVNLRNEFAFSEVGSTTRRVALWECYGIT